jgi:hypothetical protein
VSRVSYVDAIERQATPPAPPRPLAAPAYLLLPERELVELMRAQSLAALELVRTSTLLEVPHARYR